MSPNPTSSEQAFALFRSHVAENFALQEGLREALDVGLDEVVALGAAHGLRFTADDIRRVQARGEWTRWELETFGPALPAG